MPQYQMAAVITGTRDGQDWPKPGETVRLPEGEARHMLAAGLIVEAASPAPAETAAVDTKPRARKPRG